MTDKQTITDKTTFFLTQMSDLLRDNTSAIEDAINELGQIRATLIVNFGDVNGVGQSGIRVNENCSTLSMMMDVLDQLVNQPRPPKPDSGAYTNRVTQSQPIVRGSEIKKSWSHDAGAYAQCSACLRYSDDAKALTDNFPCVCGKIGYWSGSFKQPTASSMWSDSPK